MERRNQSSCQKTLFIAKAIIALVAMPIFFSSPINFADGSEDSTFRKMPAGYTWELRRSMMPSSRISRPSSCNIRMRQNCRFSLFCRGAFVVASNNWVVQKSGQQKVKSKPQMLQTKQVFINHQKFSTGCVKEPSFGRLDASIERYRRVTAMRMSTTTPPELQAVLSEEDQSIYTELSLLSAKIRRLDDKYYGNIENESVNDDRIMGTTRAFAINEEVSDEEYDALARREAEICTLHPHLLERLEKETGLGKKATRFGGRVGRVLDDDVYDVTSVSKKKPKKSKSKAPAKKRIKRQHLTNAPMHSLDNAMDDFEAVAWLNRVRKLLMAARLKSSEEEQDHEDAIHFPIQIMAEPKIDGLSLSLRYELRGNAEVTENRNEFIYDFVWGATRGDGTQGEDVSETVKNAWMNHEQNITKDNQFSIPASLFISSQLIAHPPAILEIRGEVVLPQKAFEEFSFNTTMSHEPIDSTCDNGSKNTPKFSNARNAASGILLRSKEPTSTEEIEQTRLLQSKLRFYAYDIVASISTPETSGGNWHSFSGNRLPGVIGNTGEEMMTSLKSLGFCVPDPVVIENVTVSSDTELNGSDIPNLLSYHHGLTSARDSAASQPMRARKTNQQSHNGFEYAIDGVVYKLSSLIDRQICGSSSRTPRWAIAHKFPPQSAVTHLIDIDIQVGRTGALTPVAILDPVDLGGVTVSRASLHNFHYAKKILIGKDDLTGAAKPRGNEESKSVRRGISVLVSRAGDVIPQVVKRIFDDDTEESIASRGGDRGWLNLDPPKFCPACGSETAFDDVSSQLRPRKNSKMKKSSDVANNENNEKNISTRADDIYANLDPKVGTDAESGQVMRCTGPQLLCQPRAVGAIVHAYSRAGLDVKGISESRLRQLMEENIIRFPADLFAVFGVESFEDSPKAKDMLDKLAELPGWGALSSQNLAESIRTVATEGVPLSRYIYALGIRFIGSQSSQLIASAYKNVDAFLDALEEASSYNTTSSCDDNDIVPQFEQLLGGKEAEKVKGIGPSAISALISFSKEETLMKAAKDLASSLKIHDVAVGDVNRDGIGNNSEESLPLPFQGMTIVFTGTLPGMSRMSAQKAVMKLGAKSTPNSISKSTSLVVEGEKGGKKARQARELGVEVIDADEFMNMLNHPESG
ncbi:hypothetical protein ACHAXS_007882 [Conticribra weissflogii]